MLCLSNVQIVIDVELSLPEKRCATVSIRQFPVTNAPDPTLATPCDRLTTRTTVIRAYSSKRTCRRSSLSLSRVKYRYKPDFWSNENHVSATLLVFRTN